MFEDLSCLKKIIIFLDLKRNETLKRGLNDKMSFKMYIEMFISKLKKNNCMSNLNVKSSSFSMMCTLKRLYKIEALSKNAGFENIDHNHTT